MTLEQFNRWLEDPQRQSLVMGVLNVTPDSFSDGGRYVSVDAAVAHAEAMVAQGAQIIDVGGESTRPGSLRIDTHEQRQRVVPVIKAIARRLPIVVSVDTTRAAVARAALDEGAGLVNDISAGRDDPDLLPLLAERKAPIVLMHMQGQPQSMQVAPFYQDVVAEVEQFLGERVAVCQAAGINERNMLLDPGIGFGKTIEHNLLLLRHISRLVATGRPVVIGTSRKSFIARVTGETAPDKRSWGTAATVAWSIANGAAVVRVHDVEPMSKVVRMVQAIRHGWDG